MEKILPGGLFLLGGAPGPGTGWASAPAFGCTPGLCCPPGAVRGFAQRPRSPGNHSVPGAGLLGPFPLPKLGKRCLSGFQIYR